jgi:probable phosphoglycerate mutase
MIKLAARRIGSDHGRNAMKLYFVRHGQSEANLLREISNRGLKHGLTAEGIAQAKRLAAALKGEGAAFDRIYSSPLLRAMQTAQIVSQELGAPFESADALREFDCGDIEGKSDDAAWAMHAQIHDAWLRDGRHDQRIAGGESFNDIRRRFVPFIQHLVESRRATGANVLLVGHGGTYRCMLPLVLSNIDHEFIGRHGIGYIHIIAAEPGAGAGMVCMKWGDVTPEK